MRDPSLSLLQGFVNKAGQAEIDAAAAKTQAEVDAGNWVQATNEWGNTEGVIVNVAHNVDFYNVLATDNIYQSKSKPHSRDLSYMSPQVREYCYCLRILLLFCVINFVSVLNSSGCRLATLSVKILSFINSVPNSTTLDMAAMAHCYP